jgi:hypothetical protein
MVASRNRRTEEHRLLIASFRIRKDFVKACSNASPSASNVLWTGDGIATFPTSERTNRSLCKTLQARNRLCFEASHSSSKSWIAFGVIDRDYTRRAASSITKSGDEVSYYDQNRKDKTGREPNVALMKLSPAGGLPCGDLVSAVDSKPAGGGRIKTSHVFCLNRLGIFWQGVIFHFMA